MGGNYYIRNKNGVPLFSRKVTTINNVAGENSNSTSEVVLSSILIPANTIVDRDFFSSPIYGPIGNLINIKTLIDKTGTNGEFTGRIRIGPNQSIADTLVATCTTIGTTSFIRRLPISRDIKATRSSDISDFITYNSDQTNITIPDLGQASVYPITFTVPIKIPISRIRLTLNGYSHTYPRDVAMVLVDPEGRYSTLTSRNGGNTPITNVNVTFDWTTPTVWDGNSSGTFKNNTFIQNTDITFSGNPIPTLLVGTNSPEFINFFSSEPIGGQWKLYIQDFVGGDSGSLSGASLTFSINRTVSTSLTEVFSATTNERIDDSYSGTTLSNVNINWGIDNYISVTGQLTSSSDQMNCKYIYVKKYY